MQDNDSFTDIAVDSIYAGHNTEVHIQIDLRVNQKINKKHIL